MRVNCGEFLSPRKHFDYYLIISLNILYQPEMVSCMFTPLSRIIFDMFDVKKCEVMYIIYRHIY